MAKSRKTSGKLIQKQIGGVKGKRPQLPIAVESNTVGDRQAMLLHYAFLSGDLLLTVAVLYWGGASIYTGISAHPIGWVAIVGGILALVAAFFVARSVLWLSIMVPVMSAAKNKSWKSQEELCHKGLKMTRFFPAGSGLSLVMLLVQSLLTRGEIDQAITWGEEQEKLYGDNPKFLETIGPLHSSLGMAHQMNGSARRSIVWTGKAIESFTKTLDKYATQKKSWTAKLAELQGGNVVSGIKNQLLVAYFNNASSHFNLMNYHQAKIHFQKAMELAPQTPDFPEKADILKASREALLRLKHT